VQDVFQPSLPQGERESSEIAVDRWHVTTIDQSHSQPRSGDSLVVHTSESQDWSNPAVPASPPVA